MPPMVHPASVLLVVYPVKNTFQLAVFFAMLCLFCGFSAPSKGQLLLMSCPGSVSLMISSFYIEVAFAALSTPERGWLPI